MNVKIITGPIPYDLTALFQKQDGDYIIGVDQGCELLIKNNIYFDLALGDFDSIQNSEIEKINKYAKKILKYPQVKNQTDSMIALEEAIKLQPKSIEMYGGIGKRFDHSYANLLLIMKYDIKIITESVTMYGLKPGKYSISNDFQYISLFALKDVTELSLSGFKYELNNHNLSINDPLCISNEGSGIISFSSGFLLVIHQNESK